jgi:hypothetical protein
VALRTNAPGLKFVAVEPLKLFESFDIKPVKHVDRKRASVPSEWQPDDSPPSSTPSARLPLIKWIRRLVYIIIVLRITTKANMML